MLLQENNFTNFKHKFIHTRDYKISNPVVDSFVGIYEKTFENIPLLNKMSTYNVFYVKNDK